MTSEMDPIETKVVSYIRQCDPDLFASSEGKREVVEHISRSMATHIMDALRVNRDHLMAEQAFMLEAVRDPRLCELALRYKKKRQGGLVEVCERLGSSNATEDAWILINAILQIEHENLLVDVEEVVEEVGIHAIERRLTRLFQALLG